MSMKRGLSTGDIASAAPYDDEDDDGHGVHTQTRDQRKKSKKQDANATKTKQPAAVTAASGAATSQQIFPSASTTVPAVVGSGHSDTADDQSEVHESMLVSSLKREVAQLRGTVHQLQTKVEFLLSFVGISESTVTSSSTTSTFLAALPQSGSTADANVDTPLTFTAQLSVEHEKTGNQFSENDFPAPGHPPAASQSAMNYVGAARQTTNLRTVQNNFRDAVVVAVYVDWHRREQCANSFLLVQRYLRITVSQ